MNTLRIAIKLRSLWADWPTFGSLPPEGRFRLWGGVTPSIDNEFIRRTSGGVLLDIGCGPIEVRSCARDLTYDTYIGLDAFVAVRPSLVGTVERLPVASGSVDAVNCLSVLEHVFEPRAVLAEIYRVLAPGGCVRVQVPFMLQYHGYPDDYFRYTHAALRRMFEDAGFRVVLLDTDWTKGTYLNAAKMLEDGSFDFPTRWLRLVTRLIALVLYRVSDRWDRHYAPGLYGQYQSLAVLAEKP